jgi:hypothetical protein
LSGRTIRKLPFLTLTRFDAFPVPLRDFYGETGTWDRFYETPFRPKTFSDKFFYLGVTDKISSEIYRSKFNCQWRTQFLAFMAPVTDAMILRIIFAKTLAKNQRFDSKQS